MATTDKGTKAVVRRFFDAWNNADFDVIEDVMAVDAESHNPFESSVPPGPEGEKQLIEHDLMLNSASVFSMPFLPESV